MSLPELFGPYLLHHRLAQGATSEVFLAQTVGEYPRLCVVKRILPALAALPDFAERFRRDAALLCRLVHGNLVQVLEVGAVEEQPFIAMEHVDGVPVAELISAVPEQGPLPPEVALYVGLELTEAVSYIDLRRREEAGAASFAAGTPWALEVMLSFDGVVKVVDLGSFGALRLGEQRVSRVFRSPGYCAPEVILRRPLDLRSSLYAVGVTLWELCEGRRLITGDPEPYVRAVIDGSWQAPLCARRDLAGDAVRLIAELLRLDPAARPQGVEEVRQRLVTALRRLAPAYGSSALSQLLFRRCGELIHASDGLTQRLVDRARTEPRRAAPPARTRTYGHVRETTRSLVEPAPLRVGDVIPGTRYRLVRFLGQGGSAEVCAAQHVDLDRQVAIKILSPRLAESAEAIAQFRMEARACSRIAHPGIVDVIDFGELSDGRFYFAMELLDGETLVDLLAREKRLAPARAIGIARQIAKALQAAHDHGIVHRDLKPDNVMLVTRDGRADTVKLLDFGVMAFPSEGASGEMVGTLGYMAPEQIRGEAPTPAIDLYAFGVLLYEALSGVLPYHAATVEEFAELQASLPPPALRSREGCGELPAGLERVIQRALERDPGARHASIADLEADLLRAQREAGLETPWDDLPPPGQSQLRDRRASEERPPLRPRPRGRLALALGAGVVAAGIAALAIGLSRTPSPPTAPPAPPPRPAASVPAPSPEARALGARIDEAVANGYFTAPPGENALELLARLEALGPALREQARASRRRIARTLEGAGDRLALAGLPASARTLYAEALRFDPDSKRQIEFARGEGSAGAGTAARAPARPASRPAASPVELTQLAWLLSQVQLAVAEGRYIRPPARNALVFLTRLRELDPTGEKTVEARRVMTTSLRGKAAELWARGEQRGAASLYQMILLLDPNDAEARARLRPGADAGPPRRVAAARPPAPSADPAGARAQLAEGKRQLAAGKLAEASASFQAALRANPRESEALCGLAQAAFEGARYTRAVELARQALELNRQLAAAHLVLGDASYKLHRHDDARRAWSEVLRIDPKNRTAARRLERVASGTP
jgi:serine/threonine protein kinase/Flp pilus assembly protein TadD